MGTTPNASANPKNRYPRPPLPKTIMRWHCGEKIPLPTEQETCPLMWGYPHQNPPMMRRRAYTDVES